MVANKSNMWAMTRNWSKQNPNPAYTCACVYGGLCDPSYFCFCFPIFILRVHVISYRFIFDLYLHLYKMYLL